MKEQDNELFFVEVEDPDKVRRNLLETLREILQVLQRFEKFRQIRHRKIESIQKLRESIKDANRLMGRLRGMLPKTNLRAIAAREPVAAKEKKHKKGKKPKAEEKQRKPRTELDKLEEQLNAIEGKLKELA